MRPLVLDEIVRLHQRKQWGLLDVPSCNAQPGRLYAFRREYITHDEEGNETGKARSAVTVRVGEENVPQRLTVLDAEIVYVFEDEQLGDLPHPRLSLQMAQICGYKTVQTLRESWLAKHPRSPLAKLIYVALGDVRDRPIFLNWTGGAGGDYTRSRHRAMDDAEALTREQMRALAGWNKSKDEARRAKAAARLREDETLAQRVRRLESARERLGEEAAKAIRQHLRVVTQRVDRAEGRRA
jgi:hypothetical protein